MEHADQPIAAAAEGYAWKGIHGEPLREPLLLETSPNVLSGQPILAHLCKVGLPLVAPARVPRRATARAQVFDRAGQVEVV